MFAIRQFALVAIILLAASPSVAVNQDERELLKRPRIRAQAKKINKLTLLNGKTGSDVEVLANGLVVDVTKLAGMTAPSFNIAAVASSDMQRVEFTLQSGNTTKTFTDTSEPFTMCKETACPELGLGEHTVTAKAFPCRRCRAGVPVSASFTIVQSKTSTKVPVTATVVTPETSAPVASPVTAAPVEPTTAAPGTSAPVASPVTSAPATAAPTGAPVI